VKIVHICLEAPYIDGWGYQENMLPKHHAELGHEVTVIGSRNALPYYLRKQVDYSGCVEPYMDGLVRVVRVERTFSILDKLNYYPTLPDLLASIDPDLVYHHGGQSLSLLASKAHVDKYKKARLFVDFHAEYYNTARTWFSRTFLHKIVWRTIIRHCLSSISQIYCISPSVKELCEQLYGIESKRMEYLYLGVDALPATEVDRREARRSVRMELGMAEGDFLIVTGGKLNQEKRIEVAVEAVGHLDRTKVHLAIFGAPDPGEEDYPNRMVQGMPRIHLVGWCDAAAINRYYLASDLAVFPGGQSVLWQQAIAAGVPALFRRWPGNDYMNRGNCQYLYTDQAEELEQWLRILTDSENFRILEQMRTQAKAMSEGEMSYRVEAERIVERFYECVGR